MKNFIIATLLIVPLTTLRATQCEKYEFLTVDQHDGFIVGGKITRLRDHRFAKSNDSLDPLVVYVGFESLRVKGLIEPLPCKMIAVTKDKLSEEEVKEYFENLSNAMSRGLLFYGRIRPSVYGEAFSNDSPVFIEKE